MVFQYRHGDKPLEGYMILRGIGRGGFGEVYYAQSDSGREVALKVIHQNHDIELRGVRHCMNLKSPHLITIFDVKRNADGLPFVIMEYVAGPSLRDLLKDQPHGLGTNKAAYLLRELAKGLSYLHERGIVHRDLKPENIFYEDGYVKIGDYGLSKYISVSRQSGQTISVGTVHYMAPEIGSGNYHRGIDIYSLGIIFYELLTGNVPFNGDSMGEILMKHLTLEPDVSGLDPLLQPVVKKALAKSPGDRYGDANDLVADLFRHREIADPVALLNPASFIGRAPVPPEAPPPLSGEATAPLLQPPTPLEASPTVALPGPRPAVAKAMPAAPAAAPAPAPQPAAPAAAPKAAPALGPFFGQDLNLRLVLGLGVAGMAAFALGIFPRNESFAWIASCFGLIAAGSLGPVLVEHWAGPRFQLDESWFSRRFFTLLASGPLMVLIAGSQPAMKSAILPLLLGLAVIDWRERTRTRREEKISLGQAFTAGLFGFIITAINITPLLKTSWILLAGIFATMSLAINAASPFEPKKKKGKEAQEPKPALAVDPPGAAPGPGLQPARGTEMSAPAGAPTAFQAAPPILAPAGAPAALAASLPRLERPRGGRLIAGVCAGIANRYGMDPVWVRVLFVIIAFFTGIGILAYPILWISMPKEKAPAAIPARPLSALPPAPKKYRGTRIFLNLTAAGLISGGAMILVKMLSSGGPMPTVSLNLSMNMITFGFIFLMIALAVKRRHERAAALAVSNPGWRFSEDNPVRLRQRASRRWSVLGAFLVLLALLSAYGGSVLASAAGDPILLDLGFNPAPDFSRWNQHRGHLMVALMLFIPGVFCLLIARQPGGAAHVLRGAVGWAIAGIFLGYFAIEVPLRLQKDPKGFLPFSFSGGLAADELMALLIFGIFTVMCLAWPGKQMN
ncbi:MAG: protein kinase [Planctomycetes bacterium]|nr:protein kinase [Planctomycetota bacterium]